MAFAHADAGDVKEEGVVDKAEQAVDRWEVAKSRIVELITDQKTYFSFPRLCVLMFALTIDFIRVLSCFSSGWIARTHVRGSLNLLRLQLTLLCPCCSAVEGAKDAVKKVTGGN